MIVNLGNGHLTTIDYNDWHLIKDVPWYALVNKNNTYAYSPHYNMMMHRVILGLDRRDPRLPDHIDGDGLNNTRANLHMSTRSLNAFNVPPGDGYKGVSWAASKGKWKAQIKTNYKNKHLGYFDDPIEAAKVYDLAAFSYAGEFAYINFPTELKVGIAGTLCRVESCLA